MKLCSEEFFGIFQKLLTKCVNRNRARELLLPLCDPCSSPDTTDMRAVPSSRAAQQQGQNPRNISQPGNWDTSLRQRIVTDRRSQRAWKSDFLYSNKCYNLQHAKFELLFTCGLLKLSSKDGIPLKVTACGCE